MRQVQKEEDTLRPWTWVMQPKRVWQQAVDRIVPYTLVPENIPRLHRLPTTWSGQHADWQTSPHITYSNALKRRPKDKRVEWREPHVHEHAKQTWGQLVGAVQATGALEATSHPLWVTSFVEKDERVTVVHYDVEEDGEKEWGGGGE
jgi:hypothetical protein